jgi:hypothetical protein
VPLRLRSCPTPVRGGKGSRGPLNGDDRPRVPGRAQPRGATRTRSGGSGTTCNPACCVLLGGRGGRRDLASETWLGWCADSTASRATSRLPGLGVHHRPARGAGLGAGWPLAARGRRERPGRALAARDDRPPTPEGLDQGGDGDAGDPPRRPARRSCCGWWPGWPSIGWRRSWASDQGRQVLTHRGLRRLARAGGRRPCQEGGNAMRADDASSAEMRRPPDPDADPLALTTTPSSGR